MKVILIAAMTVDGFIGRDAQHVADWTSKEDKQLFVQLTKEAGVVVMGSRTFVTIGRALPERRMIVYTNSPQSITTEAVETTNETPTKLVQRLQAEGASGIAVCGGASIYDLFIRADAVDEIYLTIEPKFFGKGVGLFTDMMDCNLTLLDMRPLNSNSVLLHYRVKR